MPNLRVTDLAAAAEKFKQRGQAAARDYENGLRGSGQAWQANTAASEENYEQGVTNAIGRKAFGRGVQASGGAFFEERATTVGAQRFAPGIAAAAPIWAEGFAPYADTLKSIDPGPKGPKGDQRNYQRAQRVGEAMRNKKLSMR